MDALDVHEVQLNLEKLNIEIDQRKRRRQSHPFNDLILPSSSTNNAEQLVPATEAHLELLCAAIVAKRDDAHILLKRFQFQSLERPLFLAAKYDNIQIMERFISLGVSVNIYVKDLTPLCIAAHHGHSDMVKLLCTEGMADLNLRNKNGSNAFFSACKHGHLNTVQVLHLQGAKFEDGFRSVDGMHALHVAVQNGHTEIVKYLLDKMNGDPSLQSLSTGTTPLHIACCQGNLELVRLLISRGADVLRKDSNGWTPCATATQLGLVDILRALLNAPSPNSETFDHDNELYFVHFFDVFCASRVFGNQNEDEGIYIEERVLPPWFRGDSVRVDIIRERLEEQTRSLMNISCSFGRNPLMFAYLNRIDVNSAHERIEGLSPFMYSCKIGNPSAVSFFLQKLYQSSDSWLQELSPNGWTALHFAARGGFANVLRLLISTLAKSEKSRRSSPIMMMAAASSTLAAASSAIRPFSLVDTPLPNGMTPIYVAAHHGHLNAVEVLVDEGGANIGQYHQIPPPSSSPLYSAAKHGHLDIVRFLQERGSPVLARSERGSHALHAACNHARLPVVKYLIEVAGVDPFSPEDCGLNGWLPLHMAARVGALDVVEYLLEGSRSKFVDIMTLNAEESFSALHIAASHGRVCVVKFLVSVGADLSLPVGGGVRRAVDLAALTNRTSLVNWLRKAEQWGPFQFACDTRNAPGFVKLLRTESLDPLKIIKDPSSPNSLMRIVSDNEATCACEMSKVHSVLDDLERGDLSSLTPCKSYLDDISSQQQQLVNLTGNNDNNHNSNHHSEVSCRLPRCALMLHLVQRGLNIWTPRNHFLFPKSVRQVAFTMLLVNQRLYAVSESRKQNMKILTTMIQDDEEDIVRQEEIVITPLPVSVLEYLLSFLGR